MATFDPFRGEIAIRHHQAPFRVDHGLRVETLLAIADRQRHVNRRQSQSRQLLTVPAPERQMIRSAQANARSMRSK